VDCHCHRGTQTQRVNNKTARLPQSAVPANCPSRPFLSFTNAFEADDDLLIYNPSDGGTEHRFLFNRQSEIRPRRIC